MSDEIRIALSVSSANPMNNMAPASDFSSFGFPAASPELETFRLKFSPGGTHISRTMMMQLGAVLAKVPQGSSADDYRETILQQHAPYVNLCSALRGKGAKIKGRERIPEHFGEPTFAFTQFDRLR